jgi:hypothetical protein
VAALERLVASLPPGAIHERFAYLQSLACHSVGQFAESLRISGVSEVDGWRSPAVYASIGRSLSSRSMVARNLWLRGELSAAQELRDEGMALPLHRMDPNDVLFFLTSCAVSLPLWNRDVVAAEKVIETLELVADETGRPGIAAYVPELRAACHRLQNSQGSYGAGPIEWSPTTTSLADAMTGIHCSFHRAVDLERVANEPNWAAAEHLRSAGEHALAAGGDQACQERAEARFLEAAAVAAGQGALFWELRAAVSLARLRRRQGKAESAREAVAGIVGRWRSAEMCADLIDARGFLSAEPAN